MRTRDYRRRQDRRIKRQCRTYVARWGSCWVHLINDPKFIGKIASYHMGKSWSYERVPLWLRRAPKIEDN